MINNRSIRVAAGILRLAAMVLISAMLAASLCVLDIQRKYGEERLSRLPAAFLVVTSGSMEPRISAGDGICVYEEPYENLKVGDIITFTLAGDLITHQIVRMENGKPVTRGLANELEDSPIEKKQYRAKVLFTVPHLAAILSWTDTPLKKLLATAIIFVALFGWGIMNAVYDFIEKRKKQTI